MIVKRDSQESPKSFTVICSSDDLAVGGLGVCFEVADENDVWPAFVVRHPQGVAAYINRCAHLSLELDWDRGNFFDLNQRYLICAAHGALYAADTGECVSGPCNGSGLETLKVVETGGAVYLIDSHYGEPCREVNTDAERRVTDG
jgi:nitrite reductase/ring-hydroxylating ferredoxin subunit